MPKFMNSLKVSGLNVPGSISIEISAVGFNPKCFLRHSSMLDNKDAGIRDGVPPPKNTVSNGALGIDAVPIAVISLQSSFV